MNRPHLVSGVEQYKIREENPVKTVAEEIVLKTHAEWSQCNRDDALHDKRIKRKANLNADINEALKEFKGGRINREVHGNLVKKAKASYRRGWCRNNCDEATEKRHGNKRLRGDDILTDNVGQAHKEFKDGQIAEEGKRTRNRLKRHKGVIGKGEWREKNVNLFVEEEG